MIRDPLYRAIEENLSGKLNPELFERCAVDLLRPAYPGLSSVRGGGDAGMDGSIPQAGERPLPLVCTTGANVIGNLTRSLESYLAEGGLSRFVVVATSQALTPKRRRNLDVRATELGFTLLNIHAQDDFAGRLYQAPEWRRELLGLTGEPPALSVLPRSRRPLMNLPLIGREEDLAWLDLRQSDCLLIGQPGAGKTAVLASLARAGAGAFVVSEVRAEIADAVREQGPERVFVDDAHRRHELLLELRALREDIGAGFSIVATCWPAEGEAIQRSLALPPEAVRQVPLLPRTVVADIVKAVGVGGPEILIGEILDQAAGLPGLAVTLAQLSIRLGTADLATGDYLLRDVAATLGELVGTRAIPVLAAFAVGGRAGMALADVAAALDLPSTDVWDTVTRIEAGGVLKEVSRAALAVEPPALREALVREAFFRGPRSLPIQPLLASSPSPAHSAETLIRSRGRGAEVPDELIRGLLELCVPEGRWPDSEKRDAWLLYAYSGPESIDWILDHYPHRLSIVTRAGLLHRPGRVVPVLLTDAIGDERELPPNPDHPLRHIQDWVKSGRPGTSEALERRRALLDGVNGWARQPDSDPQVVRKALGFVFSLEYHASPSDRIDPMQIHIIMGHLTEDELTDLKGWWAEAVEILEMVGVEDVRDLEHMVNSWAHPGMLHGEVSDDLAVIAKAGATAMLEDLARLGSSFPGVVAWASRLAQRAGLRVTLPGAPDPVYEALFPPEGFAGDWQARHQRQHHEAVSLGARWAGEPVDEVAGMMVRYDREGSRTARAWPRLTDVVTSALAERVGQPLAWVEALFREGARPDLIAPFLRRALEEDGDAAEAMWNRLFESDAYRYLCMHAALCGRASEAMLDRAFADLASAEQLVHVVCLRGEVPLDRVVRLLEHPSAAVSAAAVEGVWYAGERGTSIPAEVRTAWRAAIVRSVRADHVLQEVFRGDPDLAKDWLLARRGEDIFSRFREGEAFSHAVAVLDPAVRRELIETLDPSFGPPGFFGTLVGNSPELYQALLDRSDLRSVHLDPLEGRPTASWIELAKLALDAGYPVEDVAGAAHGSGWSWVGKESSMWVGWAESFRPLEEHDDERIRNVGRIGRERAERRVAAAREREHAEEVYGLD